MMNPEWTLTLIKLTHTAIWAVMATAILALPVAAIRGRCRLAGWLTALVVAECIVLALNGGQCPLTDLAAQCTTHRAANFDIYLALWLSQYNKEIFGGLFDPGELVWLWRWVAREATSSAGSVARKKNGVTVE